MKRTELKLMRQIESIQAERSLSLIDNICIISMLSSSESNYLSKLWQAETNSDEILQSANGGTLTWIFGCLDPVWGTMEGKTVCLQTFYFITYMMHPKLDNPTEFHKIC